LESCRRYNAGLTRREFLIQILQKNLNTSYKKCDIKPWNIPNPEAQKDMIEKLYDIEKECEQWEAEVLFSDAVHQLHTTYNGYAVQLKWKQNTRVLPSNTWRKRYTIMWAINPRSYKTSYIWTHGMCDSRIAMEMIDVIYEDYKDDILWWKKIYLILDNARYQKTKDFVEYAKIKWIILCYLPAYCPHLNLIERLWKRLKKQIRNVYTPSYEIFTKTIISIISNTQNHADTLKTLLTMNFWII